MTAVGVAHIGAESCHLDGSITVRSVTGEDARRSTGLWHQHYSELLAYGEGLGEDLHDLLRSCVGRNVIVGGRAAEKKIADTATGEVGLVSAFAEGADDFRRAFFCFRQGRGLRHLD